MFLGITTVLAVTGSASAQTFKEQATCKFTNTAAHVPFTKAEPFLFAGIRGRKNWMHGPEDVNFTDPPMVGYSGRQILLS